MPGPQCQKSDSTLVRVALAQTGDGSLVDAKLVKNVTGILKGSVALVEGARSGEADKVLKGLSGVGGSTANAAGYKGAALALSTFSKSMSLGTPKLLNLTPTRAAVAVLGVSAEKLAAAAGISSSQDSIKCAAALTSLAGSTAAMLILGAGTGGLSITLTALGLGAQLLDVAEQCKAYR